MIFKELEFKYSASSLTIDQFKSFCESKDYEDCISCMGRDDFYSRDNDRETFYRHRYGDTTNQLTFKKKTTSDNYVRVEHNLDLDYGVSPTKIGAYCNEMGYKLNTSIFKVSLIYTYEWYVLSYYICYDLNMKEISRFIELEIKEDYSWNNESEAWSELLVLEKSCKELGAGVKNRISASLFEMFRKEL